ncbi:MAG TPA: class I SAM-dependent methyltransferase [Gemmatimonadota bacterium]|nr:class I SAM-dependent methyltransferase [Gemmatimonadota bacterium]
MQLLSTAMSSVYTGLWLGLLTREQLHDVGEHYFSRERFYRTDEYNKSGLFPWEKKAVDEHFTSCRRILLVAAGGGRELIALRRQGFEVDAFDAHPDLVRFANDLLVREGMVPDVRSAPWDHGPDIDDTYDGVIVGWGGYMHIRGRERRVRFLRELRQRMKSGAPILLSFYTTSEKARYHRWVARVGKASAWLLRRERVDLGDCLLPFYAHFFTKGRLEQEVIEGGLEPVMFETMEYGHAVGRAP